MPIKGDLVTVEGDSLYAAITNKAPVLEIKPNHNDKELYDFKQW